MLLVRRRETDWRDASGQSALPNDLAVEHEVLLAKELEHRRDVDELDAVAARGARSRARSRRRYRCRRLRRAAELAHRVNAPADALLRLEHEHVEARGFERVRGVQSREARADDDDVVIGRWPRRFNPLERADRRRRRARASAARAARTGSSRRRSGRG